MVKTISLLPFVAPEENGFFLDIPVLDQNRITTFQGDSYPFQIADTGRHFSILVKAGLKVTDSDPFQSLFLLVQRDNYPIAPDALTPFTNSGIDRIWHETILSYSTDKNVFIVPEQLTPDGQAIPFRSLFFCKKKKKFFHPPCPECGGELDLCTDDDLLRKAVLFPYSTSLKRYLFCPACHADRGNEVFYLFSRSADDQVFIKDRFDLIKDFNKLRSMSSGSFPCLDCPGHAECYITGEKAMSNIGFFSFYPFHMLFFDAEPIKAVDFIPLISGAPFEGLNALTPREADHFFFKDDERFYLEVLFLKLSFFEELIQFLYQRLEKNRQSLGHISLQSIWIRPKAFGSILPFFWDFKLSVIDLIDNAPKNHIESALTKNSTLQFMASLWFYLFFVNYRQDQETVYNEVGRLLEKREEDAFLSDYSKLATHFPSMAMENIFWNPDTRSVPHKWHEFGLKTIVTGLDFFDPGNEQDLKAQLNQFAGNIEVLKQEVKEELFSSRSDAVPATQNGPAEPGSINMEANAGQEKSRAEKQAISLILRSLKTKWADRETPLSDGDDDVLETVVLSYQDKKPDTNFDDTVEKTMILPGPEKEPVRESGFEDMEKTVILSPGGEKPQQNSGFFGEEDDLEKTVVITPKK